MQGKTLSYRLLQSDTFSLLQGLKLLHKAKKDKSFEIISRKESGRPGNMRRIFRGKMNTDFDDDENGDNDEMVDLENKIK